MQPRQPAATTGHRGLQGVFSDIAPRYVLANRLLTLGMDGVWRRQAVRMVTGQPGGLWLDVCSGTGDLAAALDRVAPAGTTILTADFSLPMLREGRRAGLNRHPAVAAEAATLPFPDGALDLVTLAFATRNLHSSPAGLVETFREFHRVLRPGGLLLNLETSQPPCPVVRSLLHGYAGLVIAPVGRLMAGPGPGYRYLAHSISRFHDAEALADTLREAGFAEVTWRGLTLGVAAAHLAWKGCVEAGMRNQQTGIR